LESRNWGEIKRVYEIVTVCGYKKGLSESNTTEYKAIIEKLYRKKKTNHESPKRRKHEKRIRRKGSFVISSFRVFVIKNKIRHHSTLQKHEGQISNF